MAGLVNFEQVNGWQVINQAADQVIITPAGQPVTGTYVYFATGEGNQGSVFVDDPHYPERNVHAAVDARAQLMDKVGRLHRGSFE